MRARPLQRTVLSRRRRRRSTCAADADAASCAGGAPDGAQAAIGDPKDKDKAFKAREKCQGPTRFATRLAAGRGPRQAGSQPRTRPPSSCRANRPQLRGCSWDARTQDRLDEYWEADARSTPFSKEPEPTRLKWHAPGSTTLPIPGCREGRGGAGRRQQEGAMGRSEAPRLTRTYTAPKPGSAVGAVREKKFPEAIASRGCRERVSREHGPPSSSPNGIILNRSSERFDGVSWVTYPSRFRPP